MKGKTTYSRLLGSLRSAIVGSTIAGLTLTNIAFSQVEPTCLGGGADIVLSGTFTEDYYTRSLAPDTVIDAREATFIHCSQPEPGNPCEENTYPVNLGPVAGTGVCWAGGVVLGANRLDASWDEMHSPNNAGFAFENGQLTVDGIRIHNVGDGLRPRGGAEGFVIKNAWLSYIRDDCVENDHLNGGLVDDSLFDGCYVGFSARNTSKSVDGAHNLWTIQNTLVRLEPMPGPREGGDYGHKGFFKWISWGDPSSRSPKLALYNNVFMAEQQGQFDGERMGVPPGKIQDCSNNIMVWLGPGDYPAELPDCFTLTTDRAVWDDAVAEWVRRHTQPCTSDADCDDGSACTTDRCDQATGECRNDALADGTGCGEEGICCAGGCATKTCGVDFPCDDANECTIDECMDGDSCLASCSYRAKDDGVACTAGMCCFGVCSVPACLVDLDCEDASECTVDRCQEGGTCSASCANEWLECGEIDGCCGPDCDHTTDLDCPATVCGDQVCEGNGEDCFSCPADCQCTGKDCSRGCCGDGVCSGDNPKKCPVDCQ